MNNMTGCAVKYGEIIFHFEEKFGVTDGSVG